MTREIDGRLIISCDRCNARLDLGNAQVARTRRNPSGWLSTGTNTHVCALCSPRFASGHFAR